MEALLEATGLQTPLFGPWSLELPTGCIACLHGPSGCGKTSLLRVLADLDPHDGEADLAGRRRSAMSPAAWRREVAFVPAAPAWWEARVGQHVADRADLDPARLGLPAAVWDWPVERLSSGESQRLAVLRSLAQRPRVLLLDEPSANLDAGSAAQLEALLRDWVAEDGRAILWVAHDAALRERLAAVSLVIREGRLERER